jgi:ubiquinone/menaquinone biosynthesis C-methylase UbiE
MLTINKEKYYQNIKELNVRHYTGEVPYYSMAPLRSIEESILRDLSPGAKILDLGCGSGRFSVGSAKLGFDVTGIDITPSAIKAAQARTDNMLGITAKFLVGDMTELPFKNEEFDYVFCPRFSINAVATIEKRKVAVKEMLRVVKPSGLVFIESFNNFYFGKGPIIPIANIIRDLSRYTKIFIYKLINKPYSGLLPGDITYKANKVKSASEGFAHLPMGFELKKWIPENKKYLIRSIPEIKRRTKHDIYKYMRYSIWIILGKN